MAMVTNQLRVPCGNGWSGEGPEVAGPVRRLPLCPCMGWWVERSSRDLDKGSLCSFLTGNLMNNLWRILESFCSYSHGADPNALPGEDIPRRAVSEEKASCTTAQIFYEPNYVTLNTHFYISFSTYKETSRKILSYHCFSEKQDFALGFCLYILCTWNFSEL